MRLFTPRSRTSGGAFRARSIVVAAAAALALCAVMASSASALQWWVGTPSEPHELARGARLAINPEGTVKSDFTLKWDKKRFEVKCSGVSYDGLYLEGPIYMGATGIVFKECVAKKPKHGEVIGGEIVTSPLLGEITGAAPSVGFHFAAAEGALATFEVKGTTKPHHHGKRFHNKECTYKVTATGDLGGSLGRAEKITTEKSFEFEGTSVTLSQTRSCSSEPVAKRATRSRARSGARPLGVKDLRLVTPKGALAPGAPLSALSTNVVISSAAGNVECTESELVGELVSNDSPGDHGFVAGARSQGGEPGRTCKSSIGPDEVIAGKLPWAMELNASGEVVLAEDIRYTSHFAVGPTCTYDAPKVVGTFAPKGTLVVAVSRQRYLLNASVSGAECPPSAEETGTFAVTSGGEPVAAVLVSEGGGGKEVKEEEEEAEEKAEEAAEEAEEANENPVEGTKGKTGYSAFEGWGVL